MTDVYVGKKARTEKGLNISQHKLKLCLKPFDFQRDDDSQLPIYSMQHNTLSPSTRAGQNATSNSLIFFFFFFNFHEFAHFSNMNRQILSNIFFVPTSPKHPLLPGNKKKFRENENDLKDTSKSNNCYPLFIKNRWRVWSRYVSQFFCLFTGLKHFLCWKHLAISHLCTIVLTESSTDVENFQLF